ncbi:DUF342 domain-containing protein [Heliobacterium gestii]|uniref:DUF342 domain-containing protein n=1 Tax=Heliomicrobium gestii TaxID=2699 RepID=A0A845LBZ0_HELGE|nr:FapA family protein [Heliomicrobium gestii]MBM7866371.1 uncharacterized protein (DUF342 family) [Heliomicrobium gestii]MZP42844.1 DUF342 domain-containing protein [Heliomicrobium gestii]
MANKTSESAAVALRDEDCVNGKAGVHNGVVHVQNPVGTCNYAVLAPGEHMQVWVDEQEIQGTGVIYQESRIEVRLQPVEARADMTIQVSKDGLEASVTLDFASGFVFHLIDQPPQETLYLKAEVKEVIPPRDVAEWELVQAVRKAGIVAPLELKEITAALKEKRNGTYLIAHGQAPAHGEDEVLRLLALPSKQEIKETDRVDYRERNAVKGVDVGALIAVKTGETTGRPGWNVRREEVPAKSGAALAVHAGPGIQEMGRRYVATAPGRPHWDPVSKVLEILPLFDVGTVDYRSGNVHFPGDVQVAGDVLDGFVVQATGMVSVAGFVYGARIEAGGHVTIRGNLIGGTVVSGKDKSSLRSLLVQLTPLAQRLRECIQAIEELKQNSRFSQKDLRLSGDGPLVKLMLENRYKDIPEYVHAMVAVGAPALTELMGKLKSAFTGSGPLLIKQVEDLSPLADEVGRVEQDILKSVATAADVTVANVQNGQIAAAGSVLITGQGAVNAQVRAGVDVVVNGAFRGGVVSAGRKVVCGELGSTGNVETRAEVGEGDGKDDGVIIARVLHPNVAMRIGRYGMKNMRVELQAHCRGDREREAIVVEKGKGK